jgi:hypothetical protein
MNHQMGLKLAVDISKQEVLQCQLDSLMQSINWKQIQSNLTQTEES